MQGLHRIPSDEPLKWDYCLSSLPKLETYGGQDTSFTDLASSWVRIRSQPIWNWPDHCLKPSLASWTILGKLFDVSGHGPSHLKGTVFQAVANWITFLFIPPTWARICRVGSVGLSWVFRRYRHDPACLRGFQSLLWTAYGRAALVSC